MAGYLLVFEIISVHLLVALVGAPTCPGETRRAGNVAAETPARLPPDPWPRPWPLTPMDLLTQPVGISHYLAVGTILFVCGVVCMTVKRNAVGVSMGIELVLNGANLNFVAFGAPFSAPTAGIAWTDN